jgi:hypothetical protein
MILTPGLIIGLGVAIEPPLVAPSTVEYLVVGVVVVAPEDY